MRNKLVFDEKCKLREAYREKFVGLFARAPFDLRVTGERLVSFPHLRVLSEMGTLKDTTFSPLLEADRYEVVVDSSARIINKSSYCGFDQFLKGRENQPVTDTGDSQIFNSLTFENGNEWVHFRGGYYSDVVPFEILDFLRSPRPTRLGVYLQIPQEKLQLAEGHPEIR